MDLLTVILFLFLAVWGMIWGIIPPVVCSIYAWRQGRKGYTEAIESRDLAMKRLDDAVRRLDDADKSLVELKKLIINIQEKVLKFPSQKKLIKSIKNSISATYGALLRGGKGVIDDEIKEAAELMDDVDPEIIQDRIAAKLQEKVMGKLFSMFD